MDTITINSLNIGLSTNADGNRLYATLKPYFIKNKVVYLSFENTIPMSSSFFNSSFGELIDEFGSDMFKEHVIPININKSQLDLIKKYIGWHTEKELC